MSDDDAGLDAELVALAGFAFADALDFGGMPGVELVLVVGLLRADAFGAFEQCVQTGDGRGAVAADGRQLAPDFAQDDTEDGALPFDGTPQAKELPGVRIAAGLAAQFLAFLDVRIAGLLQGRLSISVREPA